MQKYQCSVCGYVYDPAKGDPTSDIEPGTPFKDLPDDWVCPVCGASKDQFNPLVDENENEDKNKNQNLITKAHITKIQKLTPNVVELTVQTDKQLDYEPGQYLNFVLKDNEGKFIREYSIVKSQGKNYKFWIKLEKKGRASKIFKKLCKNFEQKQIGIQSVQGDFTVKNKNKPKVFIATSTGLAPIYRQILSLDSLENAQLLGGNRTYDDMFYLDKLDKFKNLEKHYFLSRQDKKNFYHGRIDIDKFDWDKDTEFYICGSPNMVQDISDQLKQKGFENIYHEKFTI